MFSVASTSCSARSRVALDGLLTEYGLPVFGGGLRVRQQVERVRRADVGRVVLVGRFRVRELLVGERGLDGRYLLGGRGRLFTAAANEDRGLTELRVGDRGDRLFAGPPPETDNRDTERSRLNCSQSRSLTVLR